MLNYGAFSLTEVRRPPVMLSEDFLVRKYAHLVVYYVAGWTVYSLLMAQVIVKNNWVIYQRFSQQHAIGEHEAMSTLGWFILLSKEILDLLCFIHWGT